MCGSKPGFFFLGLISLEKKEKRKQEINKEEYREMSNGPLHLAPTSNKFQDVFSSLEESNPRLPGYAGKKHQREHSGNSARRNEVKWFGFYFFPWY